MREKFHLNNGIAELRMQNAELRIKIAEGYKIKLSENAIATIVGWGRMKQENILINLS